MTSHYFYHEVEINSDPQTIFNYVTNPNKWYEWFPSSLPTDKEYIAQEVGQTFQIFTAQKPIGILPITIKKSLNYSVAKSESPKIWAVNVQSNLIDSTVTYTLKKTSTGTLFKREFTYQTKSWLKIVEPILLRTSLRAQAKQGIHTLKKCIETKCI